jgi:hypothetical protein
VHIIFFGLAPLENIKNLFGNWLVGIDKKYVKQIKVLSVLLFGLFGMHGMIKSLTNLKLSPFCRFNCYPMDLYVVLSAVSRASGCHGFCV